MMFAQFDAPAVARHRPPRGRCRGFTLLAALVVLGVGRAALGADAGREAEAPPRNRPTAVPEGVRWLRDIPYAEGGTKAQMLDLYIPEQGAAPFPVIVWIHGGGWMQGNRFPAPGAWLSAHGYAVAAISYRFSTEAIFPAQIHDCKGAIRWLRANASRYPLDGRRIGALGESAGGHLAALLGTSGGVEELEGDVGGNREQSSRVQAVCNCFGPADLTPLVSDADPYRTLHPQSRAFAKRTIEQLLGADGDWRTRAKSASVATYITPDDPPFLIVHGDQDPLVPIEQSRALHAALHRAGVPVELLVMEGRGHVFFDDRSVRKRIQQFFDAHLKNTAAAAPDGLRGAPE